MKPLADYWVRCTSPVVDITTFVIIGGQIVCTCLMTYLLIYVSCKWISNNWKRAGEIETVERWNAIFTDRNRI